MEDQNLQDQYLIRILKNLYLLLNLECFRDYQLLLKKQLEIQKEITDIETQAAATRAVAEATHTAETEAATKKFDEQKAALEEQEGRIREAAGKGPVAIAEEWKRFLSGGSR